MKFLVFSTDLLPITGFPTSGTALRTSGLISGLKELGHEVIQSVPRNAIESALNKAKQSGDPARLDRLKTELSRFEELCFDSDNQEELIRAINPDAVICGHWPAHTKGSKIACPLIIDLAGPHLLERHYQKSENQKAAVLGKTRAMASADILIASGAKQRLYFLSFLQRAGVRSAEKKFIEIPMPLPPETPEKSAEAEPEGFPRFIFGGVFLPWQNPSAGLRTLTSLIREEQFGSLTLIGGEHPNYPVAEGVYTKLFEEIEASERVNRLPMQPYEVFLEKMLESDVALDLMQWNLERELAVTIRTTTYLWSGVPIIYNNYADLSEKILQYDAGWCIDPESPEALRSVFEEIRNTTQVVARKSVNAQRLARELFSWTLAAEKIVAALRSDSSQEGLTASEEVDIELDYPQSSEIMLEPGSSFRQRFECRMDGLRRAELRLATHGEPVPANLRLRLENRNGESIAEKVFEAADIQNNEWHALEFAPLSESAGEVYSLILEREKQTGSENGQADQRSTSLSTTAPTSARRISLAPWLCREARYPLRGLSKNAKPIARQSLCLRTSCVRSY